MSTKVRPIDQYAAQMPWMKGFLPCLYVPIAARDLSAIKTYVGEIYGCRSLRTKNNMLVIDGYKIEDLDNRLLIWSLPASKVLHSQQQVWVNVDYSGYREAYIHAFPNVDLTEFVIDHVMNRRVARLKGFKYLRVIPVSRSTNSSHGSLSEKWAVEYHSSPKMIEFNKASKAVVQYADISDIVKMMNIKGGGSYMDNVNAAQKLVALLDSK